MLSHINVRSKRIDQIHRASVVSMQDGDTGWQSPVTLRGSLLAKVASYPPGPTQLKTLLIQYDSATEKDTQSQHLGLVVKSHDLPVQTLPQAGEAGDMAPDAEILPRSRSRHLLRQEPGAPALRKHTR